MTNTDIDVDDDELPVNEGTLEALAELEHDQWWEWAENLASTEDLSEKRLNRWDKHMRPYDELTDDVKEFDREYARKVVVLLAERGELLQTFDFEDTINGDEVVIQGVDEVVVRDNETVVVQCDEDTTND